MQGVYQGTMTVARRFRTPRWFNFVRDSLSTFLNRYMTSLRTRNQTGQAAEDAADDSGFLFRVH
jgi:hypothetical protein